MLELINVAKSYEQKPLLKNVSFKVEEGETICLLGASGSGKSTLLRMIAGLESPESGSILFNNIDLAPIPPHARDFGLVFQDYGLFPHLDVFNNVAFGLKMRNIPQEKISTSVAEMLELVNLQGFASRKVTELSGGEQQRVALARALAPEPRLLMFDEPLGALDRSLKEGLLNELRTILHKTKIPAIYVTHDQDEAFTIADRILLLHDGEIIRDGSPADIWYHPNSVHAARMLGVGNIIKCTIGAITKNGRWLMENEIGVIEVDCLHKHKIGETVSLLVKQSDEGGREIQLEVEDIFFKQDQFRVKTSSGLFIHLKDFPKAGQIIRVRVEAECLG